MRIFSVDSSLYRFLTKFLDVMKLNFLWILFSLPVVTVGASTAAAMAVALKMVDDEEGYIGKSFVKSFGENWKQGTILGIITVVSFYAVYLDFELFRVTKDNPVIFLIVGVISAFVVIMALTYSYPLIARYENTLPKTIRNSLDISSKYFGRTILMLLVILFEFLVLQFNEVMLFFSVIIGPGLIIFTLASFSKRIFQQIEKDSDGRA
ncbi:MAG: DUF624 domain-containing protein [Clostridiales bacterium]|nr:DUF624 domain-containing protein [Clostridiales bacterium]